MKPESIAVQMMTIVPLLMHQVFHGYHRDTGVLNLNRSQMRLLMIAHLEGAPHLTQLGHHINLEKGSLTPIIDTLIERGLVERHRNPRDRRKVNLSLTDQGRRLVQRHLRQSQQHIRKRLSSLSKEDVRRFSRALSDLHEITLRLQEKGSHEHPAT